MSPQQAVQVKEISIDAALALVQSGMRIVTAMAAAEPQGFFTKLAEHAPRLNDVDIYCANPTAAYSCFTQELGEQLTFYTMFLTRAVNRRQGKGLIHYVPQHLSQWVRNISQKQVDIFWGTCSEPDARGFVSLGLGACYEPEVLRYAKVVILEMNPKVPVTYGATHVPIQKVDYFIRNEHSLPTIEPVEPDHIDQAIGDSIAELVPDGSTIQLGIGEIPNAVGCALRSKRDLGVHTEMLNDVMMQLYEAGVITGQYKTIWPGKMLAAFAYGSQSLYDFIHQNPGVELQPASVVNDPYRIGKNHQMISINTAVEIDLTGQVCSESVGHRELSGVGGAADTHIGAQRSVGGRGIIALRTLASDGITSKIVFELKPGAKISISRNDIDTVITEYGVAFLAGKSVAQRVRSLIQIAHPSVRDELMHLARRESYL